MPNISDETLDAVEAAPSPLCARQGRRPMKGYDDWKLASPYDDECPHCNNHGVRDCMICGGDGEVADGIECPECNGTGTVDCECQEEPDSDYLYERERDRRMEKTDE